MIQLLGWAHLIPSFAEAEVDALEFFFVILRRLDAQAGHEKI